MGVIPLGGSIRKTHGGVEPPAEPAGSRTNSFCGFAATLTSRGFDGEDESSQEGEEKRESRESFYIRENRNIKLEIKKIEI